MNEAESELQSSSGEVKRKWKANKIPSKDDLCAYFRYEPETGKLFVRDDVPRSHFNNAHGWNLHKTRFGGREAGSKKHHAKFGQPIHIYVRFKRGRYMAHRIIWVMTHGSIPENRMIDHANGDPFDNRIENLRLCVGAENQWNSKRQCKPFAGVKRKGKKFQPVIQHKGHALHMGTYTTMEEASKVYRDAAENLRGEFNRT